MWTWSRGQSRMCDFFSISVKSYVILLDLVFFEYVLFLFEPITHLSLSIYI